MQFIRWTRFMSVAVMGAGLLVMVATTARGDDSKVLAGPKADAPTTQPAKGHKFANGGHDAMKERLDKLMEGVNPTDEQKTKIQSILDDTRTRNEAWRKQNQAQLKSLHEQMKTAHEAKDQAQMKQVGGEIRALMATMPVKPKDVMDQVRGALTSSQQVTFDANVAKLKGEHAGRRGAMGGKAPAGGGSKAAPQTDKNKLDI